jgi:nucleoside-diphosphate-sugar epimerase
VRILLTGATGFIGRRLLPVLAERHDVVVLARTTPEDEAGVSWVRQDLAAGLDEDALPAQVDAVVHLAQSRHYKEFPERAEDIFAVNVQGTFRLLEYARRAGARRFVYTSTGGVYGHGSEHMEESHPVSPIDFYLRSKYAAELLVANYEGLLTTVVFRLFFVYGPGQDRMLVPTLRQRVVDGEEVRIQGDPGVRINPIHVDDAVRVFEPALGLERGGTFNVAGDEAVTLTELVELLGEATGREPRIAHDLDRAPAGDLLGDNGRMREQLGVVPRVGLREGLAGLVSPADRAS